MLLVFTRKSSKVGRTFSKSAKGANFRPAMSGRPDSVEMVSSAHEMSCRSILRSSMTARGTGAPQFASHSPNEEQNQADDGEDRALRDSAYDFRYATFA
jgi:hypothetical protein